MTTAVLVYRDFAKYSPDQLRDDRGRWADEAGGGGTLAPAATLDESPVVRAAQLQERERADSVRKQEIEAHTGFPASKIVINHGSGPAFAVGGDHYEEGGHYNPRSGEITLHSDAVNNDQLVAHEVMHAKFDRVMRQYDAERSIINTHDAAVPLGQGARTYTRMDGSLKPEYAKEFPTYAAIAPHLESVAPLSKEDGVSPYSTSYWKAWEGGTRFHDSYRTPVNETLAEMARTESNYAPTVDVAASRHVVWRDRPHLSGLLTAVDTQFARLGGFDRR